MKAVVYTRYGPPGVLRLAEVETPVPKDHEVLVKVHAVSVNASDWEVLRGKPLYSRIGGSFRPRHHILGSGIAGRVEAAGRRATLFGPGEDVFADILSSMGGFAEDVCVPQSALARMPAGLSYEQAAALPQAGPSRCRASTTTQGCGPAGRCWSTAPAAARACTPSSLPSSAGPRSPSDDRFGYVPKWSLRRWAASSMPPIVGWP
jgi:NADPH:quinone reductase-like Zn-dependent oxidoreductase